MRQVINRFQLFLAMVMLTMAAGCAQLGLEAPMGFEDSAAVTLASATAARNTANQLLSVRKIGVAEAEWVQKQADFVRDGVVVARGLAKTDMSAADANLRLARNILTEINKYLADRKAK